MQENTNKAIVYNSAVLYVKMIINTLCGLLTTRFALEALGVVDYGLYAVLGGIISFIAIFNTIMLSASNRFIAVAIGKGDKEEINKQFNVNLVIHVGIAIVALLVTYPIGNWYIPRYVNYDGPLSNSMMVFFISVAGSILSFIGVPYNGLLMAKEKFIVFSAVDVIIHMAKLIVAFMLISHFEHKLLVYTITMALTTAFSTLIYVIYCSKHYKEIVRLRIVRDAQMYKSVFKFSSWVSFGAFAQVGKDQGAALLVNTFFNTAMNTAMGVASSINHYIGIFASNVIQPMAPQITKSFVSGNRARTDELLIMSTKFNFLLVLIVGCPFLVEPEWILGLWLGEVPQYASIFLVLLVIDKLVQSFNSGISNIIWAQGDIGRFQIVVSVINVLSIVLAYFVLKTGVPAYYLVVAYIFCSFIKFFAIQWALHKTLNYDNSILWKNSYIPSLIIIALMVPVFLIGTSLHPLTRITISMLYLVFLELYIGFRKNDRQKMASFIKSKMKI